MIIWGNEIGPGLPKSTLLPALRAWAKAEHRRQEQKLNLLDLDEPADKLKRRERQLQEGLRRDWPAGAKALSQAHAEPVSAIASLGSP